MSERVTVAEASRILNMSPMAIRVRMKKGLLPIGSVFPSIKGDRDAFYIYRDKLDAFIGREKANN